MVTETFLVKPHEKWVFIVAQFLKNADLKEEGASPKLQMKWQAQHTSLRVLNASVLSLNTLMLRFSATAGPPPRGVALNTRP